MPRIRSTAYAAAVLSASTLTFALPASAATVTTPGAIDANLTKVNILNINDFHGHLDDNGANLACLIEQRRAADGDASTMLLSAGDNIGASPFVSSSAQDTPTMKYLNTLGVLSSAVGNHEFDHGYSDLTGRVKSTVNFPYLGANVYKAGTSTPALQEYAIHTVNGVRVAVIGAVTADTPNIVLPDGIKGLSFGDPVEAVNRVAKQLKSQGLADVIVAEYHSGATVSTPATLDAAEASLPEFNDIATKTDGAVDVIINAHSHQTYTYDAPAPGGGTRPVIQGASYGKLLSEVQLGIDPASKKVVSYAQQNLATKGTDLTACAGDSRYEGAKKIIDDAVAASKTTGGVVIAKQTADIMRGAGESPLGNLDAQAWLDRMNEPGRPGADIGIMNPGGVRADLPFAATSGEKDGEITYAEAFAVNPFANTMQTITITGSQFKTLLEQQWTGKSGDQIKPQLGLSDNVRYTYDPAKPESQRITSITIGGKPLNPAGTYRIASGSFIIGGGDGYTVLKEGTKRTDTGLNDADEFMAWLKQKSPVSPDLTPRGTIGSGETTQPTDPTTKPSEPTTGGTTGGTTQPTTEPTSPATTDGGTTGGATQPSEPTTKPSEPATGGSTGGTTQPTTGGSTGGSTAQPTTGGAENGTATPGEPTGPGAPSTKPSDEARGPKVDTDRENQREAAAWSVGGLTALVAAVGAAVVVRRRRA